MLIVEAKISPEFCGTWKLPLRSVTVQKFYLKWRLASKIIVNVMDPNAGCFYAITTKMQMKSIDKNVKKKKKTP